jgi:DNA-binding GntR family transcriptional regulator
VTTWTAQRINDLFDARLGLEVTAAGVAARRVRAGGDLHELEAAIVECERTLTTLTPSDWYHLAKLQVAFHIALVAAAYNELMDSLMQAVGGRMIWIFYLSHQLSSGNFATKNQDEHEAILDALRSGNDRLAEALTSAHIEAGRAPMVAALAP